MQGFNMGRYYPPDASNPPVFNTSHPLGARANKISKGILTVRFELPFAVWCQRCTPPAIVGQGVRFNAEKKKVGNYYSTPIWSFRMKHSACGGWWEIRTDPKNAAYVVTEGVVKRDYGPEDKEGGEGELKFLTAEEKEKRRDDAFARLEGKVEDKSTDNQNKKRVEELYEKSEVWRDPYDVNARLRRGFREKRREWKKEDKHREGMQEKFSLGIDIVDETDGDRVRARMIEFGGDITDEDSVAWKPLFEDKAEDRAIESTKGMKKLKAEVKAEKSRQSLQKALVGNTKAVIDPFMANGTTKKTMPTFAVLKRKREDQPDTKLVTSSTTITLSGSGSSLATTQKKQALATALVGYDSD
ncbi:DUF572-domain-containing protein [Ophiobolus disseminans]|uniref:DUF572-domain-containing protein n=1 Tax=Ophiobolus disseminans TaxID=1469910 RepID=A0A6A6ZW26_9PLEO|nr:DUF572-domain-containing protein [Ophiobolus disseminans]